MTEQDASDGRTGWTPRKRVAATLGLVFATVQVTVPLWRLTEQRPSHFGWQMYSAERIETRFFLRREGGRLLEARPENHVFEYRADLDVERYLPPHLCRIHDDVEAVLIRKGPSGDESIRPCR